MLLQAQAVVVVTGQELEKQALVRSQAVLGPAVDSATIALGRRCCRGAAVPGLQPRGARIVAEDGAELHDDVEELQAVHIREPLQVFVHAGVVQLSHQLSQPPLPALQEPALPHCIALMLLKRGCVHSSRASAAAVTACSAHSFPISIASSKLFLPITVSLLQYEHIITIDMHTIQIGKSRVPSS